MDVDSVFAREYLAKIGKILGELEHGGRSDICDDIIAFHDKIKEKYGKD